MVAVRDQTPVAVTLVIEDPSVTTVTIITRVHKQQIKDPEYRKIKLSEHIDVCGRGQFKVFPFYKFLQGVQRKEEKKKNILFKL